MAEHSDDQLGHYCGVAGILTKDDANIPELLFYPLYAQQHRGQESAGVTYVERSPHGVESMTTKKGLGLVSQVLTPFLSEQHPGRVGIGHNRYSTHGGNLVQNAQPFHIVCNKGEMSLAHNGNISNIEFIRRTLTDEGAIFSSTSDTEVILHLISRSHKHKLLDALTDSLLQLQGAFSMVLVHQGRLYAIRDPRGFRPLYIGSNDKMTVVVSETCGLDILGITDYREVEPGEIIVVKAGGAGPAGWESHRFGYPENTPRSHCIFEFIYFARPDSEIFGRSVYRTRQEIGRQLASGDPVAADVVIPVPDSGNAAALGYAQARNLPFEMGLTRNHFAGRSFTLPSQSQREFAVKMKLNPIPSVVRGKSVVLVDDSLVRGTTSKRIVKLLRDAGAREIHLRLSAPEIKFPCFFGIDIPTRGELISNRLDPVALAAELGADTVRFLPMEGLRACTEGKPDNYCYACFNGVYPEPLDAAQKKQTELK
ncbi:MAG TPA: amidophosphoribosyltransferase [Spirochaetia bacterium]|nr:amidophosphoribosyltransferase [Spirochaetia bacterium]